MGRPNSIISQGLVFSRGSKKLFLLLKSINPSIFLFNSIQILWFPCKNMVRNRLFAGWFPSDKRSDPSSFQASVLTLENWTSKISSAQQLSSIWFNMNKQLQHEFCGVFCWWFWNQIPQSWRHAEKYLHQTLGLLFYASPGETPLACWVSVPQRWHHPSAKCRADLGMGKISKSVCLCQMFNGI